MSDKDRPKPEAERILERLTSLMVSDSPERRAERKRVGTRCGHIKRKLKEGQPLEGELLEFAIEMVGGNEGLADKLRSGQQPGGYELHLMLDVHLLHARLGREAARRHKVERPTSRVQLMTR